MFLKADFYYISEERPFCGVRGSQIKRGLKTVVAAADKKTHTKGGRSIW